MPFVVTNVSGDRRSATTETVPCRDNDSGFEQIWTILLLFLRRLDGIDQGESQSFCGRVLATPTDGTFACFA